MRSFVNQYNCRSSFTPKSKVALKMIYTKPKHNFSDRI